MLPSLSTWHVSSYAPTTQGMQLGIDDKLVELLGRWSPIPVTYAGGARTLVRYHTAVTAALGSSGVGSALVR